MATNSFYRTPHLTTISFAVGVLLFFLPFMEIKCNETTLGQMSGLNMVTGAEPEMGGEFDKMAKGLDTKNEGFKTTDEGTKTTNEGTKTTTKSEEKKGKVYIAAIVALGLGVIGVAISFMNKGYSPLKMIAGAAGAIALIILMFQLKSDVNSQMTVDKKGSVQMDSMMKISVEFTFWFYLCVISYLASAFFSYKQKDLVNEAYVPPVNAPQINVQNPGDQSEFPAGPTGEKDLG